MFRHADTCAPCGLDKQPADHLGHMLALLQHDEEPLALLTHLLRWCRAEHRTLWENSQQYPDTPVNARALNIPWPSAGASMVVEERVRAAMAAALVQDAETGPPVNVARTLAVSLDDAYWPSFRASFERRSPYQPDVDDPIPVDSLDMRTLTEMTPTSPRWRLANRLDETRHVRLAGEWAVQYRIVFDYSASTALAGLLSPDTVVATCHPNESLDDLDLGGPGRPWLFPVAPRDAARQAQLIDELLAQACAAGASIVVLPELATTKEVAATLESWVRRDGGPALVVTGSYHEEIVGAHGGAARRANTAVTWLRGHPEPLVHHKHSPGDRPKSEGIQPQGWPELRVYVGSDGVHLVIAVCRDLLNPSAVHALTEVGANLVLVPAMSETLTAFVGAAANLVTSTQAVVAVSNNPAVWATPSGETTSRPARALLAHPGLGTLTRLVQPSDATAGVAVMKLSSGQVSWLPATGTARGEAHASESSVPPPSWLGSLTSTCAAPWPHRKASITNRSRCAAVLVLLSSKRDELCVLLTRRTADLAAYPGMIAFPGDHVEASDESIVAAALREAKEEVGLDPGTVHVQGTMAPTYLEADDLIVYPVLAWRGSQQPTWSLNYAEVDALAEVPLRVLARRTPCPQADQSRSDGEDRWLDGPGPIGELTRSVIDRLVATALRENALDVVNRDPSSTRSSTEAFVQIR